MRLSIAIALLVLTLSSFAQTKILNTDLTESDSPIIFKDVINHISVEGIKVSPYYIFTIQGAMLSLRGSNKFVVSHVSRDSVTINVFKAEKSKQIKIYSKLFRAQTAGAPSVVLDEEYDDSSSNGQILNQTRLEVKIPNPNYDGDYQVAHFEISLKDAAGNIVLPPTFISGKYLGKVIYDKIVSLPSGGKILFTQIILTYSDGGYMQYKDFVLEIK
jgi:hypothetical protein